MIARCVAGLLALGLLVPVLGTGCSPESIVPAVGPNEDISIFTHLPTSDPALQTLARSLRREVYTTRFEHAFDLEHVPPSDLELRREFKNLFFVTPLQGETDMARVVRDVVGREVYEEFERGERPYAVYSDVFAAGQTVVVIAAPTSQALAENMTRFAEALYDTVEQRVRRGLEKSMYVRGEHGDFTGYLERTRDWTLRVPRDYQPEEDAARNLLLVHNESPERWLFVQSTTMLEEDFTPENVLAFRRAEPRIYADETVRDEDLVIDRTRFAGHEAIRIRGRWQSSEFVVGGPLVLYAIHVGSTLYVIDYLVFLPSLDKLPYLRQLDAIAHTFRLEASGP